MTAAAPGTVNVAGVGDVTAALVAAETDAVAAAVAVGAALLNASVLSGLGWAALD